MDRCRLFYTISDLIGPFRTTLDHVGWFLTNPRIPQGAVLRYGSTGQGPGAERVDQVTATAAVSTFIGWYGQNLNSKHKWDNGSKTSHINRKQPESLNRISLTFQLSVHSNRFSTFSNVFKLSTYSHRIISYGIPTHYHSSFQSFPITTNSLPQYSYTPNDVNFALKMAYFG